MVDRDQSTATTKRRRQVRRTSGDSSSLIAISLASAGLMLFVTLSCVSCASDVSVGRARNLSWSSDEERPPEESAEPHAPEEAPTTTTTTTTSTTTTTGRPQAAKSKIPPVNFTRVDEMFNAVVSEAEAADHWRHMDKQMLEGVRSVLKVVFPMIVSMSSDAKVSGSCSGAILKWILNLRNLRSWAVKMLDASGKPSSGILEGSLTMFGNYRECLGVRAPDEDEIEVVDEFREYFRGKYCVLQMRPHLPRKPQFYSLNSTVDSLLRKDFKYYERNVYDDLSELALAFNFVHVRADLCVPSLCSRDDIQRVADFLANKVDMRARVLRCDVEPSEDATLVDETHLLWLISFAILLLLVVGSTLASLVLSGREKRSKTHSLLTCMSIAKSFRQLAGVDLDVINDSKPAFLYTLRLFVLLWIIIVSLTSQLDFQFLRDMLSLRDVIMQLPMQLVVNSSLQFDALILFTAFTFAYQNVDSNLRDLLRCILRKYFRLIPSIMLLVALTVVTPLLYQNRSPVWHDFVDRPAQVCRENGLVNLLFLQNLLSYDNMCLPQTWIFCVELQLCVLAIPLVYLMNRNFDLSHGKFRLSSRPIVALVLLALVGCAHNFLNVYLLQLPAAWFQTFPDKDDRNLYLSAHLTKSLSHLTPFAVGLFAGHLCRCKAIETFSGRPYGRKCCTGLIWSTSVLLMATLVYSTHAWSLSGSSHLDAPVASAIYAALAPLLWAISWSLLLFNLSVPDEKNQRSRVADLLTVDVNLVRLGRLTFLAYLISPYVNQVILAVQEQTIFSSLIMMLHLFCGNLVLTFGLSIVVALLVEIPCRRIVKKLLLGSHRHCGNLGVITRQSNIRQQIDGPSHDCFTASQHQQQQQQQQHEYNQVAAPRKASEVAAATCSPARPKEVKADRSTLDIPLN